MKNNKNMSDVERFCNGTYSGFNYLHQALEEIWFRVSVAVHQEEYTVNISESDSRKWSG